MPRIIIKDIEELNEKKQQIIELQKKVEELNEVRLLKEKRQQESELNTKIKKLSTYDSMLIGDIIAKLMTEFEGVLYRCVASTSCLGNFDYIIEPESIDRSISNIYSVYKLSKISNEKEFSRYLRLEKDDSLSFLLPSSFKANYTLEQSLKNTNVSYINYFIDFLYNKRSNTGLYVITNEQLETILQEFLLITKDLQQQRIEEINKNIEERIRYKKRLEFEESCLIDRKLIYNSLSYIVNNYENNMLAKQEHKEERNHYSQWTELYGYHNLIIQNDDNMVCFEAVVDKNGCYPDEEYCGLYVDMNKDTNICFFYLKKSITPIIKNSMYVKNFIDMIENLYNSKVKISPDDIQQMLVVISNDRKVKKGKIKLLKV